MVAAGQAWVREASRLATHGGARSGLAAFDPRRFLAEAWAEEVERRALFPWIAVAFGAGILLFFAADGPSLWAPLAAAVLFGGAAVLARGRPAALRLFVALAALFLGFAAGVLRVRIVDAPRLERVSFGSLSGFVQAVEERPEGARLVVLVHTFKDLAPERRPARVRVSIKRAPGVKPGDFVTAKARLLPPPEPARPGGYDFARDAYFRGLGAVGSVVGKVEVGPAPVARSWPMAFEASLDAARNAVTQRIAHAAGGQAGAVAAALVTGKRGLITEDTNAALRAAGIYHVVSISGLHMVLAAGVVFWIARALLALVPAVALRWPVKKIAAILAMLGAAAYCVFAGSEVAAERSLIMTLVMLGAILVDRPALSMRNLAIAALIVLAREPESLLGPSFQMSFGAVAALIAAATWVAARVPRLERPDPVGRAAAFVAAAVLGTLGTTLVATLATAPFGTYHFQNLNPYGLIGNALTLPLVSLAIMPGAVIGMLAYPFGLDGPVWWVMGLAVRAMLDLSHGIAGLGHATLVIPAYGPGALAAFVVALIVLTVPASALRWLGLLPAAAGFWLAAAAPRHDLYLDRDGSGAAVRGPAGRLVIVGRPPPFLIEQWLKADGDGRGGRDGTLRAGARCDALGCVVESGREIVAYVSDRRAFEEDCRRAGVVVTRLRAPDTCRARTILDRTFLAGHGATALRWTTGPPDVASARRPGETRPWTAKGEAAAPKTFRPARGGRPGPPADPEPHSPNSGEPG